jgi:phosphotransferase system HPr-like phosphotransfer protein
MSDKSKNAAIANNKKRIAQESLLDAFDNTVKANRRIEIPREANLIGDTINSAFFYRDLNGHHSKQVMINRVSNKIKFIDVDALFTKKEQKERVLPAEFVYEPHQQFAVRMGPNGVTQVNIYQPPWWREDNHFFGDPLEKVSELPECYQIYFNHLVDGEEESYKAIINWIAYAQKGRNETYMALAGGKGVGKSILGDQILKELVGEDNFINLSNDTFKNQFNGEIENKALGYLDEIHISTKSRHQVSKLKLMNRKTIRLEKKGHDAHDVVNYLNLYISSNDYEGIPLEDDNRRLTLPNCTHKPLTDTKLIKEIIDPKNIRKLGLYLLGLDIKFEDTRTPFVSEIVKEKIWDANSSEWEKWAYTWILFDLPELYMRGEVRLEKFQQDFFNQNPDTHLKALGKNRLERFVTEHKELGWKLKKHPTTRNSKGYRSFERI